MSWGFVKGRTYNRRADIHARFGGQQQGGIITPGRENVIFIMTGKRGAEFGYEDRELADGGFEYYGEGQVGDMEMVRGNRAIRDHVKEGKDLLLFQKNYPDRTLTLLGNFVCEGWHDGRSRDRDGTMRRAIVFELRNLENIVEAVEEVDEPIAPDAGLALDALRQKALEAAGIRQGREGRRTIYERSVAVRDYVLARAGPSCEGCQRDASFLRRNGSPYLEPHHIRRVSDGGPDDPRFVIALCETCHRRVHHGADGTDYNAKLLDLMQEIENSRV